MSRALRKASRNSPWPSKKCSTNRTMRPAARERALAIAAAEIGTLIIARAVAKAKPVLSDEILTASRRVLGEIAK